MINQLRKLTKFLKLITTSSLLALALFSFNPSAAQDDAFVTEEDSFQIGTSSRQAIARRTKIEDIKKGLELKNLNKSLDFETEDILTLDFEFSKKTSGLKTLTSFFKNFLSDEYKNLEVNASLKKGNTAESFQPKLEYQGDGEIQLNFEEVKKNLRPGKYQIELEISDPKITDGEVLRYSQDFTWGVLAFNSNKSLYKRGDEAYLQFAVLDDNGNTLCDADIEIEINTPGFGVDRLSTFDNTITKNLDCGPNNVIDSPDYFAYYLVDESGEYEIEIVAYTKNGERQAVDSFRAERNPDITVERIAPTRIWPKADYDMDIIVEANEDFEGDLVEIVPKEFKIFNMESGIRNQESGEIKKEKGLIPNSLFLIQDHDSKKELTIKDISLKKGDILNITYSFDAPNVSPEFFLLGELELKIDPNSQIRQLTNYREERAWQIASDAVGTGIAWMAATSTSNGTDINPATSYPLEWWEQDFDSSKYSFNDTYPSRLVVDEPGDYLVAITIPMYRIDGANNRTRIETEFRVNGTKKEVGVSRPSYIRNSGGHDESSNNMTVLLEDLTADQYIEIFVKGITSNRSAVYIRDQASMFVEKIEDTEVVFSGFATSTTDSTDLSGTSAFELEWLSSRKDTGYTHSSASTPEDITLDEIGNYYVSVNVPLYTTTARANVTGQILLGGTPVSGGIFQQGYIRITDTDNYSSIHWNGVVQTSAVNQVLSVSTIEDGSSGTVTVNGENATIYVQRLPSTGIYYGRGTNLDVGADWNDPTPRNILWENDDIIDTEVFTHSTASNQHQITVSQPGDYLVSYNDAMDAGAGRPSNMIELRVNGTAVPGAQTNSHYIREPIQESSAALTFLLTDLVDTDVITVTTKESGDTDIVNDMDDAILFIRYIDDRIPPVASINSVTQKTDGSGAIDISIEAVDGNDDEVVAKVEYVNNTTCDFTTPLDSTIDSTDSSVSADYGDPDVDNEHPYQVGTTSARILTDSGSNTVDFDWLSKNEVDDATSTYCVRVTLEDETGTVQTAQATSTIFIDNYDPQIEAVDLPDLMYAVGDTLTATITVTADSATYIWGTSTINNATTSNLQKINDTTYTIDYQVWDGDTDRATGSIPFSIRIRDQFGNLSTAFTGTFTGGSIDSNSPGITQVSIPEAMYKVDDTIQATITVTSDSDEYQLAASTINSVTPINLVKQNDTTYTLDYDVLEGHTDQASSTIPISIVLRDSYGNENSAFTSLTSTASIDANSPVMQTVYISNGDWGVGDAISVSLDATEAGLFDFNSTVNGQSVTGFTDQGDSTYLVIYTVQEGDTDRGSGNIPVSIVLRDNHGNVNTAFTAPAVNSASVDANKPQILTIQLPNQAYAIGDTVRATTTITADTNSYSLGTTTINNVDATNLQKINDSTYTFDYIVQEGDQDRLAGTIPVSLMLKDQLGQYNDPASTTVLTNTASIDSNKPVISSVSFTPVSGILKVGEVATATISLAGAETLATVGSTMNINGVDVTSTFSEVGGGDYEAIYTIQEGDIDHPDDDDLPVNFKVYDASGNESDAFLTASPSTRPGVDANTPVISSVSFTPSSGTLKVGDTATATISVTGAETGLLVGSTLTINGIDVSASFSDIGGGDYEAVYTVQESETDVDDTSEDLTVNFTVQDPAGNESSAYTTADSANRPGVDANTPSITNVTFSPSSGVLKVGDIATATITVAGAETGLLAGNTMTINSIDVSGTFSDIGGGQYEVVYTVQEGNADRSDSADLPIVFTVQDTAGNESLTYNTADSANRPGVDGNTPSITDVSFDPTSGTLKVGDTATATITVAGAETGLLAGNTMTINLIDVTGTFSDIGGGQYEVAYTVQEGNNDVNDIADLPINFTIQDTAGNESSTYSTADAANRPGVDANTPTITNLTFVPTSGTLQVGDIATATVYTAGETNLLAGNTITINNVDVSGTFNELGSGQYELVYTVGEGNNDISDSSNLPVSITVQDAAGNESSAYTASDIPGRPGVDANTPTISTVTFTPSTDTLKVGEIATATLTVSPIETGLLVGSTATINGVDVSSTFSDIGSGQYELVYTVSEGDTDVSDAADLPVNFQVQDSFGNESSAFTAPNIANRPGVDANTPSQPGNLSFYSHTNNSITLNLDAETVEDNFSEYKIFYKIGSSGVSEADSEWNSSDDINLGAQDFNSAGSSTITGLATGTMYYFNIFAYDSAGNVASASVEAVGNTNYRPVNPANLDQREVDRSTQIPNGAWANGATINMMTSSSDPDGDERTFFYELVGNASSFTSATTVPGSVCASQTKYEDCSSNIWTSATTTTWYDYDWLYRKQIIIDSRYVESDETDFVVLASTTDSDLASHARSDGFDILFTKVDGTTPLDYEREYFNNTTGELIAWVQTDVSSSSDTVLFMYYGNASMSTDQSTTTGVWDDDFVSVLHLDESPANGGTHYDSTANGNDATFIDTDGDSDTSAEGKIDGANQFTGDTTNDDYLSISSTNALANQDEVTISYWASQDTLSIRDYIIWADGNVLIELGQSYPTVEQDAETIRMRWNLEGTWRDVHKAVDVLYEDSWHFWSINLNNGTTTIYRDGEVVYEAHESGGETTITNTSATLNIGCRSGQGCIDGYLDEFRISTVDRGLGWQKTSYHNQNDIESFLTISNQESATYSSSTVRVTNLPNSATGYKWQVMTCDSENACSDWTAFNATTPNLKIDHRNPTRPGDLSVDTIGTTFAILNFGSQTVEDNFQEYKIFYKTGTLDVTEGDTEFNSGDDPSLGYKNYDTNSTTTLDSLTAGTDYVVNIWAYDQSGAKARATEISFTTLSASNPPTGVFNSIAQKTDGSGAMDISMEIDDQDNDDTIRVQLEYESGTGCTFGSPLDPTLDTTNITSDNTPEPDVDNAQTYQIGNASAYILTSPGSNTVNFDWLSKTDLPSADGNYCLRLTANDGTFDQTVPDTQTSYIDNVAPDTPGDLIISATGTNDVVLEFGATSTDSNFDRYRIFYAEGTSADETDQEHSDSDLLDMDLNYTTNTSINGLTAGTQYTVNIFAYDDYGNVASATEVSFWTNAAPENPGTLLEYRSDGSTVINNGDWTNENEVWLEASVIDQDNGDQITLYFEIASTSEPFNSSTASACSWNEDWFSCSSKVFSTTSEAGDYTSVPFTAYVQPQNMPDEYTGYKWQVSACDNRGECSSWVDSGADPNFKMDSTAPSAPGNLTIESYTENTITLGLNAQSTEANFLEYIIYYKQGTTGVLETDTAYSSTSEAALWYQDYNSVTSTQIGSLLANTDYVFNIMAYDQAGNKTFATEVTQKTNNSPTISFDAINFRRDGTGVVDIDITVDDADDENLQVKVEYEAGLSCTFGSPLDPNLDETDSNATSTNGDAKLENDNEYQVGNASGWIETTAGANSVHFDWQSQDDVNNQEGNYCLRVTANDSHEDSSSDTLTVYVDNLVPTQPGELTLDSINSDTVILQFGATSSETNWLDYTLYYKEGVTAVSESDTEHIDSDLLDILFNDTSTTSITGLSANTQYSFRIFAHDTYGNISQSNQTSYTTNAQPSGIFNSAAQKIDASGRVDISVDVYDINGDDCYAKLEYEAGATCAFGSPLDPTLDEDQAYISADYGAPGIENDNEYQIGTSTAKIITSSGSNTLNFDWLTKTDIPSADGTYCLRLTVYDETDTQIQFSTTTLVIDNAAPTPPADLVVDYVTGTEIRLNFGLEGSDTNFDEYKIFYKKDSSGVSESDQAWTQNDDASLGLEDFGPDASTTIPGLFQNSDYYFNIWIYDTYGNKASASEVSTTTLVVPSATWREVEDAPDPTAGEYAAKEQSIRLRISVANTGTSDAQDYNYQLEYGEKSGDCQSASWIQVPVNHTTEAFEMIGSLYYVQNASTTERLANSEGYTFVPGYLMKDPNNVSGDITLATDQYTELEYGIAATTNASRQATYCFRVTDSGTEIDNYDIYPEFSLTPPPISSFVSATQRSDGTGLVEIQFDINDFSDQPLRAKMEFATGTECNFSSPQDPVFSTLDSDTSATYDDPGVDNDQAYQIGTTSSMITTQYGTNTVEVHWESQSSLQGYEGEYCLRLTANDTFDDQMYPATTTVTVDNKAPSAPGDLTVHDKTLTSVTLNFGATSSDFHFQEYIIYYKEGESGVTEADTAYSSSSDINLYALDFNGVGSTTISGLTQGKQYVFRIWAYDAYGNKAASLGEVDVRMVPSIGGIIYSDEGVIPDLSGLTVSIAVDGVLEDSIVSSVADGRFTFSDIQPPATGTPIMVFIDNEVVHGAAYSLYGGEGEVTDFHIYQNRIIFKHYEEGPLAATHIDAYDKDQDNDIPIRITGIDMAVDPGYELYVWPGSTFENSSGNITVRDMQIEGELTAVGEQQITVTGSWDARNGTFNAASSTVEFTSTGAGNTIYVYSGAFYNLNFNGAGGEWTFYSNASSTNWATTTQGTLIQGANIDLEFESFTIMSGASFTKASGTGRFIFEGPNDGYFEDQNAVKNNLGNVRVGYSPATTRLNSDFVADSLIVGSGDSFFTRGYEVDITNDINVIGTLDAIDDKEGDGSLITLGGDWTVEPSASFIAGNSTTTFDGTGTSSLSSGGTDASHDFNILTIEKSSTATVTLESYDLTVSGNFYINSNSVFDANTNNYTITAAGNWDNDGTFEAGNSSTTFSSLTGGHSVAAGNSSFHNLEFANASGGWTITENATTTNNLFITSVGDLTVNSGLFIEVQGTFLNKEGGTDTTWANSTLYLNSAEVNQINDKTSGEDSYGAIRVGPNTDISMWNSSGSSHSTDKTGSLYSQDHSDTAGNLYIWGDYLRTSGTEYWSYSTDFDGTDLTGGSERQAIIRLNDNATTTFQGANLEILGSATASTTIDNQGSGTYHVETTGGTLNAQYFDFKNLGARGLYLNGTINISNLDDGSFELALDSGSCLTVNASTLNANATTTYTNLYFATSTSITGYNVNLNGSANTFWTFVPSFGNLTGDKFDFDAGDPRGYLVWADSDDYEPRSQAWRFYHDEDVATPQAPAALEEVSPATISPNSKLKLRMTINEFDGIQGDNVKMRLQFSEYADFSQDVYDVGEIGSTSAQWRFFDGAGVDNASIAARVLSDSDANATYNESATSQSSYSHIANTAAEWEFAIHAHSASTGTVYYFRPIVRYDTLFPGFEKAVPYDSGKSFPSLAVTEASLSYSISGIANNQNVEGILTDVTTTASQVSFGNLNIDTEVEAAQRFTITSNADHGYQLFVMQKSNLLSQNGADIDPVSATNDAPAAWPASPFPSGFGYHTGDDTLSTGFSSRFAANNTYCQFQSSMEEVAYSLLPVEAETIDFVYKLEVSNQQEAGDYQTEIVYILVPTF